MNFSILFSRAIPLLFFVGISLSGMSQSYDTWIVGDPMDVQVSNLQSGIVLAGGGGDNDDAMQWFLNRADGGDILVIRASNSNGYNDYLYSDLGVTVNSVRTIRFNNVSASSDPFVLQEIQNAEALFIAGGDQFDYYNYWKDTPVEAAINDLINVKGIPVGGTSAGMAILGDVYYTPSAGSLTSSQALGNPFHQNVDILGEGDFINMPFLSNVVTDTHYDQRDRQGRHFTFIARMVEQFGGQYFGIACNEFTAVCIDENGLANVFGDHPQFDDYAYFLKSNCQPAPEPELIQSGMPLTWDRSQSAVKAYKLPGTPAGTNTFDLTDWETGSGGSWEAWYADNGVFDKQLNVDGECDLITSTESVISTADLMIFPNPFQDIIQWNAPSFPSGETISLRVFDVSGALVYGSSFPGDQNQIDLSVLPSGMYFLELRSNEQVSRMKVLKE